MSTNLTDYNPIQEWNNAVADVGMSTYGGNLRVTNIITSSLNATDATEKCLALAKSEPFFQDAGSSAVLEVVRTFFTSEGLASVSQLSISTNLVSQEVAHCSDPSILEELQCLAIGICSDPLYDDNEVDCLLSENEWIQTNEWLQPTGWSIPKGTVSVTTLRNTKILHSYIQEYDINNDPIDCITDYELIDGVCYNWISSFDVSLPRYEVSWFRVETTPLSMSAFDDSFRLVITTIPIDAPTDLNATDADNQMPGFIQVTWVAVPGAVSYNVYRSVDKNAFDWFDQDNLTANQELMGNTTEIWFSDTTLTNIGTHYYWVGGIVVSGSGLLRVGDLSPGIVRCSDAYSCEPYSEDITQASCESVHPDICVNKDTGIEVVSHTLNNPDNWEVAHLDEDGCTTMQQGCYYDYGTLDNPRNWQSTAIDNESTCNSVASNYPAYHVFWHVPSQNNWKIGGIGEWIENWDPTICLSHGANWTIDLPGEEGSMAGDPFLELAQNLAVSSGQPLQITLTWTSNPTVNPAIGDCFQCLDVNTNLINLYTFDTCTDSGICFGKVGHSENWNNQPEQCIEIINGYCDNPTYINIGGCEQNLCSDPQWPAEIACLAEGICTNSTYNNNEDGCVNDGLCDNLSFTTEIICEAIYCSDTQWDEEDPCMAAGECWDENVAPVVLINAYENQSNLCEADISGYCVDLTHDTDRAYCETAICSDPLFPSSVTCETAGTCSDPIYTNDFSNCIDTTNGYCELTTGLGLHVTQYSGYQTDDFDDAFDWFDTATVTNTWITSQIYDQNYDNNALENFAQKYQGYFKSTHAGEYTFRLNSDDSSWLWLGNKDESIEQLTANRNGGNELIDNSGAHPTESVTSDPITLEAHSYYPILIYFGQGIGSYAIELYFTPPGEAETFVGLNYYRQLNTVNGPATYPDNEASCEDNYCSDVNYLTQQTCEDSGTCLENNAYDDLGQTICESDANGYCDDGSGQTKQLCIDEGTCSEVIFNNDPTGCLDIVNGFCSNFPDTNTTQVLCETAYSCSDVTWTDEVSCEDLAGLCFNDDGTVTPAYDNLENVCLQNGNCWDDDTLAGIIIAGLTSSLACTLSGICSDPDYVNQSTCEILNETSGYCDDVAENDNPNYTTATACEADRCSDGSNSNEIECLTPGTCTNPAQTDEAGCIYTAYCSSPTQTSGSIAAALMVNGTTYTILTTDLIQTSDPISAISMVNGTTYTISTTTVIQTSAIIAATTMISGIEYTIVDPGTAQCTDPSISEELQCLSYGTCTNIAYNDNQTECLAEEVCTDPLITTLILCEASGICVENDVYDNNQVGCEDDGTCSDFPDTNTTQVLCEAAGECVENALLDNNQVGCETEEVCTDPLITDATDCVDAVGCSDPAILNEADCESDGSCTNPLYTESVSCEAAGSCTNDVYDNNFSGCIDAGECVENPSLDNNGDACIAEGTCTDPLLDNNQTACEAVGTCTNDVYDNNQVGCEVEGLCDNNPAYDNDVDACVAAGECVENALLDNNGAACIAEGDCSDVTYNNDQIACEASGTCTNPDYNNNQSGCVAEGLCDLNAVYDNNQSGCEAEGLCDGNALLDNNGAECAAEGICTDETYNNDVDACILDANGYCDDGSGQIKTECLVEGICTDETYNNDVDACVLDANGYCDDLSGQIKTECLVEGICTNTTYNNDVDACIDDANGYCDDASGQDKTLCLDEGTCVENALLDNNGAACIAEGDCEGNVAYNFDGDACIAEGICSDETYNNDETACLVFGTCTNDVYDNDQTACLVDGTCTNDVYDNNQTECELDANGYCDDLSGQIKTECIAEGICTNTTYNNDVDACELDANGYCDDLSGQIKTACIAEGICTNDVYDNDVDACVLPANGYCDDGLSPDETACLVQGTCTNGLYDNDQTACELDANGYCSDASGVNKTLCLNEGICTETASGDVLPDYNDLPTACIDAGGSCSDGVATTSGECYETPGTCTDGVSENATDCATALGTWTATNTWTAVNTFTSADNTWDLNEFNNAHSWNLNGFTSAENLWTLNGFTSAENLWTLNGFTNTNTWNAQTTFVSANNTWTSFGNTFNSAGNSWSLNEFASAENLWTLNEFAPSNIWNALNEFVSANNTWNPAGNTFNSANNSWTLNQFAPANNSWTLNQFAPANTWNSAGNTFNSVNNNWDGNTFDWFNNTWNSEGNTFNSANNSWDPANTFNWFNNTWVDEENVFNSEFNTWNDSGATWGNLGNTWGNANNTWNSANYNWNNANNTWESANNTWGNANNTWTAANGWLVPTDFTSYGSTDNVVGTPFVYNGALPVDGIGTVTFEETIITDFTNYGSADNEIGTPFVYDGTTPVLGYGTVTFEETIITDFTNYGSADNVVGTIFDYDGTTPVLGYGTVTTGLPVTNSTECAIAGTCLDTDYNDQESVCMDVVDGGTCTDTTKNHDLNACTVGASNGLCQDASWTTEATCTPAGSCTNDIGDDVADGFTCPYPVGDVSAHDNDKPTCVVGGVCRTRDDFYDNNYTQSCANGYEESSTDWWWEPWQVDDTITSSQACAAAIVDSGNVVWTDALWSENSFVYPNNSTVDNGDRTFGDANTWTANTWVVNTWEASNTWFNNGEWVSLYQWAKQHDWLPHIWAPNNYSWSNNRWVNDGNVWGQYYTWDNPNSYEYANSWLTNTWDSANNTWAGQYTWWDNSYLNAGHTWYAGSNWNTYTFTTDGNSWGQQHTWTPYTFTSANNNWGQQHTWSLNSFDSDDYDWYNHYQWETHTVCTTNNATWIPDPAFQNPPDSYGVYRALNADHLANPPEYHYLESIIHAGAPTSQQTYVDVSNKSTDTYYYKVTQKSEGVESEFSDFDSGYETQ